VQHPALAADDVDVFQFDEAVGHAALRLGPVERVAQPPL
jgi:hypothetical protein